MAAIANSLRAERNLGPVSTNWPSTYDYKQALCEDSGVVQGWFNLVANIKAKLDIYRSSYYSFRETRKAKDSPARQQGYKKQQGSLPNSVLSALEHYAKGGAILSHKLVLAQQQIAELQAANEAATRRKSHKRKRVQKEGTLIVEDGQRLAALKEFGARGDGKRAKKQVRAQEGYNRLGFSVGLAKVILSPVNSLACWVLSTIFYSLPSYI
ncbi:hypothetical protein OPT61_g8860 [Boeremia exigua]|uniref:Uncharacterized protein n=1 Tax=Boeremia exigua TaxID=749465 RepID=A0ACC2HXL6_9PLEO|nr:hypothetical protein OPT61_g8860 [Boeremia exigua]